MSEEPNPLASSIDVFSAFSPTSSSATELLWMEPVTSVKRGGGERQKYFSSTSATTTVASSSASATQHCCGVCGAPSESLGAHLQKRHNCSFYRANVGANVEMRITGKIKGDEIGKAAVVLCVEKSQFLVCLQSRIRGDAELQVSASVQVIPEDVEWGEMQSLLRAASSSSPTAAATSSSSPPSSPSRPQYWRVTVQTAKKPGLQVSWVVSNKDATKSHDTLISRSNGLLALYPTHAPWFDVDGESRVKLEIRVQVTREEEAEKGGEREKKEALMSLPLCLSPPSASQRKSRGGESLWW